MRGKPKYLDLPRLLASDFFEERRGAYLIKLWSKRPMGPPAGQGFALLSWDEDGLKVTITGYVKGGFSHLSIVTHIATPSPQLLQQRIETDALFACGPAKSHGRYPVEQFQDTLIWDAQLHSWLWKKD